MYLLNPVPKQGFSASSSLHSGKWMHGMPSFVCRRRRRNIKARGEAFLIAGFGAFLEGDGRNFWKLNFPYVARHKKTQHKYDISYCIYVLCQNQARWHASKIQPWKSLFVSFGTAVQAGMKGVWPLHRPPGFLPTTPPFPCREEGKVE